MEKILVVEDDKHLNKSVCIFLEQKGFEVFSCEDGNEAFALLYKKSFDLIISDIMMPNVDGFQLVENVRQLNKNVPIILLTAKDDFSSKQKGFTVGIDDYLVKPVDLNELYLRIKALFRRVNINQEKKLVVGNFSMDIEERCAYINDEPISLTSIPST